MVRIWVIKKDKNKEYYRSSLRNPEGYEPVGALMRINWVPSLLEAKFFQTKKQATEVWGDNKKPIGVLVKSVTIEEE